MNLLALSTAILLHLIDWIQTHRIANRPDLRELNPLIRKDHINGTMIFFLIVFVAVFLLVEERDAGTAMWIISAVKAVFVINNARLLWD